jgi:two-component system CheB/CheR fusion protein
MLMQAQMLGNGSDPKAKLAGEAIERATRMQVRLIDDLLDISRIVAGKLRIDIEPVDLGVVIEAAVEGVRALAGKKSIQIDVVLDQSSRRVSGDPVRLQQIVSNLLTNAIKFTPAGGRVTVALDVGDDRARLTVTDTGMGIDPAFLPRVFNRFSQEDGSSTRPYGGLGLGLAIVRHLVEAHGGTVAAESRGTGKGTKISVMLPLVSDRTDDLADVVRAAPRSPSPRGARDADDRIARHSDRLKDLRVLVVEDDRGTRESLSAMLAAAGATVGTAETAAEGMAVVDEFRPDVILCDIAMPGEDGYSLIRRIRARGGNVPAMALTAFAGEEDRQRALSAGFQMHVAKPVDILRLTEAVAELSRRVPGHGAR